MIISRLIDGGTEMTGTIKTVGDLKKVLSVYDNSLSLVIMFQGVKLKIETDQNVIEIVNENKLLISVYE